MGIRSTIEQFQKGGYWIYWSSQILQTMSDVCGILQRSVAKNSQSLAIIDMSPI